MTIQPKGPAIESWPPKTYAYILHDQNENEQRPTTTAALEVDHSNFI
jgi:hypothetical protein